MRFKDLKEDGRIVKGVNTTVDVGVNQIPIEASKLGFTVDKNGRPPTLSKKVKGKSTNVLFNLGLSESNRKRNLTDFISFCKEQLELTSAPSIKFVSDTEDATFGYFDNDNKNIVVQLKGRHQMDVMRTVAHELVHYKQDKTLGRELDGSDGSVDENEANSLAGVLLRRWGQKNPTLFTETVDNNTESSVYFTNMQEQLGEIASTSEIYVDMDGVLADFFGEWARLMKVDHFTKIDKEHEIGDALQRIRDTDDFWLRLPVLPQARELLTLIKNIKGEYNICSTPLQDDPNSEKHKRTWLEKNLSSFPPKNVYITNDKSQYATNSDGIPNILIDDFGKNVSQWEAAGGIGFKYKDHKFERTAKQLQKHIAEKVNIKKDKSGQVRSVSTKAGNTTMKQTFRPDSMPGYSQATAKAGNTTLDVKGSPETGYTNSAEYKSKIGGKNFKMKARQGYDGLDSGEVSLGNKSAKKVVKRATESYTRSELPQITKKHLKTFPHKFQGIKTIKAYIGESTVVTEDVAYVEPQFDAEWEEANRYPYIRKLGREGWRKLAKTGKTITVNNNNVKKISNTGADGSESLDELEPKKVERFKRAMDAGTIEMPIVIKQPNGSYDLVAGNTRLIGLMNTHGEAKVWLVDANKLKQPVKESFDTQVDWEIDHDMTQGDGEAYKANIGNKEVGIQYYFEVIDAGGFPLSGVDITFEVNMTTKKTGTGDASTIFGAVVNHIKQFINQHDEIDAIEFSASKEQGFSRTRLYSAMVEKLSQGTGFINAKTISKADKSIKNADVFKLIKRSAVNDKMVGIDEPVKENIVEWIGPVLTEAEDKDKDKDSIITPALEKLDKLFTKNKYEIRIVGGAVRDIALDKAPKDIDLATDATPIEMQRMFGQAQIRNKPTGIEHGTITAILDGENFEITTLRSDTNTDGRHAEVEFVRSWEEDAKRRDLTYNAMSMDFNGKIYDYHGGMDDLQNKVSKFVGDPEERIKEDYLRILRYFRFQGRLTNPKWDKEVITAIKANSNGLTQVSVERIWQEMSKILSGNNVSTILTYMEKAGVTKNIKLSARNINQVKDNEDAIISLARIVDNDSIAKTWKLSKDEHTTLITLVKNKDKELTQKAAEDLIVDGKNKTILSKLAELQGNKELAGYIRVYQAPTFPVNGNDLMAVGVNRGPEMGQVLQSLKTLWKQSNFEASKEDLLNSLGEKDANK